MQYITKDIVSRKWQTISTRLVFIYITCEIFVDNKCFNMFGNNLSRLFEKYKHQVIISEKTTRLFKNKYSAYFGCLLVLQNDKMSAFPEILLHDVAIEMSNCTSPVQMI